MEHETTTGMTRKEWKALVERDLASICHDAKVALKWTTGESPAAVIDSAGRKTHLAPNGIWFLGSENKAVENLIPDLEDANGVLRTDPCFLGKVEAYRQPKGRLAILCELPTEKSTLEGIVSAVVNIQAEIAALGKIPFSKITRQPKRRHSNTNFKDRCKLAVILADAIVRNDLESKVNSHLASRVFGIGDYAPIVGESLAYREERKNSTDSKSRLEHVIPCKVLVDDVLLQKSFHQGMNVDARVKELTRLLKIVKISSAEQMKLDRTERLKTTMTDGWQWNTDCVYARLRAVGIKWEANGAIDSEPCQCVDCGP
jgi:hypothetical protein